MVDVRAKEVLYSGTRIGHQDCTKRPSYGLHGSRKAEMEFCAYHKELGMIEIVSNYPRCAHPGCTIRPSLGLDRSKKAEFCAQSMRWSMSSTRA